jgi:hypothetical protein
LLGFLSAAVLALIIIFGFAVLSAQRYQLRTLQAKLAVFEREGMSLAQMHSKVALVKGSFDPRSSPAELISAVYRSLPPDVYLVGIALDDTGSVSLRGTCADVSGVFRYIKGLQADAPLTAIATKYVTKRRDRADFEITARLEPYYGYPD